MIRALVLSATLAISLQSLAGFFWESGEVIMPSGRLAKEGEVSGHAWNVMNFSAKKEMLTHSTLEYYSSITNGTQQSLVVNGGWYTTATSTADGTCNITTITGGNCFLAIVIWVCEDQGCKWMKCVHPIYYTAGNPEVRDYKNLMQRAEWVRMTEPPKEKNGLVILITENGRQEPRLKRQPSA